MSENPNEGRPAGSRSYGDSAGTAVRQAATATPFPGASPYGATPTPQGPGPQIPPAPEDSRSSSGIGTAAETMTRALSGAGRSFAKVGAALGNSGQNQRPQPGPGASPGQARVRKARLRVARVDPWSVMKVSFVLSIAMGIVTIVGTAVVWNVLNALGVFSSLNKTVGDLTSSGSGTGTTSFNLASFLSFGHVESYMVIVALVDVVLVTALATLGAYLYNLASGFVGGFEVTLAEDQ